MSNKKYVEIPRVLMNIGEILGEGQFGLVNKGQWESPMGKIDVAIKTAKDEDDKLKLLQEAVIMGQFLHTHIVRMYGVSTLTEPVSVHTYMHIHTYICMYILT